MGISVGDGAVFWMNPDNAPTSVSPPQPCAPYPPFVYSLAPFRPTCPLTSPLHPPMLLLPPVPTDLASDPCASLCLAAPPWVSASEHA
eukprot:SAG11_NODE_3170_length_2637_cov_4.585500_2_plen_88_part_00